MTVEYHLPGIHVTELLVRVPLDWNAVGAAAGAEIDLLVRELVAPDRKNDELPLLLYLEGGPGGASPRPLGRSGWIDEALEHYRVVLIDQRGTGRSNPLEGADFIRLDAETGADFLSFFRADSIIRDVEHVRRTRYGGRQWAILGQSYGGFLALTYLSTAPAGLSACYICGGIPGVPPSADEVYRRTFTRARRRSEEFYRRFPDDLELVEAIADRLADGPVHLPDGDILTVRRFQSLGLAFGMGPGLARMHWLFERALVTQSRLSTHFLERVMVETSSAEDPLFWTLQENIYADAGGGPTAWAAERRRDSHPEFGEERRPLLFTAEMAFPWMFDEIRLLRPFRDAVHALAARSGWPALYDEDALAANEVPLAAAVYFDDLYVDSGLQLDTLGRIGGARAWVTNEFEHDGISSGRVLTRLRELVRDSGGER
ncbi:alpha/beta fold hydrolase [Microbacterium sp. NPDC058342]|uniref:alpha/beta fold hydrolase n=1 Tax=Microbacterium sp. NPDC058342 TaxID=3346454 RepID=UPI0036566EF2